MLASAVAAKVRPQIVSPADAISAVLAQPDAALDHAQAKLAFDALIDPSGNGAATMAEIDRLAGTARRMAGPGADAARIYAALRTSLYVAGEWNEGRPFAYDHDDPAGQEIGNKLLANYLRSRKGNCVSMPVLFLILAERLGLDAALVAAPLHLFVRLRIDGRAVDVETTSGGHPAREAWFRENFPIPDLAVANGIYLRALPRREAIAHLATTVAEHLAASGRHDDAARVCTVILRHFPRDVYAMVKLGTACGQIAEREFLARYRTPFLIPSLLRPRYFELMQKNRALFAKAEALGWEPVQ